MCVECGDRSIIVVFFSPDRKYRRRAKDALARYHFIDQLFHIPSHLRFYLRRGCKALIRATPPSLSLFLPSWWFQPI